MAKYQLFDDLCPEEYAALESDIKLRKKVMVPVEVDENDEIIDGHNRSEIADRLGIKYKTVVRKFKDEAEKREYVIKINLCRRHLDPIRWGQAFAKLLKERGVKRGKGKTNQHTAKATIAQAAEECGVPERTAKHRLAQADKCEALPKKEQDAVNKKEKTLKEATRDQTRKKHQAQRDERASEAKKATKQSKKDHGVILGDFREVGKKIKSNSVDFIFTDPPYDRKSVPMYEDLAKFGERVLKPGGSLMCYIGSYALPDILALMTPHLRYLWTCCCLHTGSSERMDLWGIVVKWKPILWFVKGERDNPQVYLDDLIVSEPEKDTHAWQQGVVDASYYIEKLTLPNELVVDPFCGGGTTAVAAKQMKRRWKTFEIDENACEIAKARVMDV